MNKSQDVHSAELVVVPTQTEESDGKAWHRPTLATWEVQEETLKPVGSGPDPE